MSVYTVSQINSYIRRMFREDFLLQKLTVCGEASGCKYWINGQIYFNLKEENSLIGCVMYSDDAAELPFTLTDGVKYRVTGQIRLLEKRGEYKLIAQQIVPDGQGELHIRFEELKKKLSESGMFDLSYKQEIPKYIRTLGVVTAETGAAVRDIIHVARRRNPYVRIIVAPAVVQGVHAAPSIVRAIETLAKADVDCMIVGRGGGSIEDLWAFNEESVAQAIFDCPVPVISAVGHETDYTIADFVADLRAPTPSAAAELAVFEYSRFAEDLQDLELSLADGMGERIDRTRRGLDLLKRQLMQASPGEKLGRRRLELSGKRDRMLHLMERHLTAAKRRQASCGADRYRALMESAIIRKRRRLDVDIEHLEGASPVRRLKSGYAYVADAGDRAVRSVSAVKQGDSLTVTLQDGSLGVRVEEVRHGSR